MNITSGRISPGSCNLLHVCSAAVYYHQLEAEGNTRIQLGVEQAGDMFTCSGLEQMGFFVCLVHISVRQRKESLQLDVFSFMYTFKCVRVDESSHGDLASFHLSRVLCASFVRLE